MIRFPSLEVLTHIGPCKGCWFDKNTASSIVQNEGLDGTLQNTLLEVVGEDAPGIKATLQRGTELANMGRMRSSFEVMLIPLCLTLGGLVLTLMNL